MKNTTSALLGCMTLLAVAGGCKSDLAYPDDEIKNQYAIEWINHYGLVDPKQDWNMATTVTANVAPESFGDGSIVNIYNKDPRQGGVLMAQMSRAGSVNLNVLKGADEVYVRAYSADQSHYIERRCPIVDAHVDVQSLSRAEAESIAATSRATTAEDDAAAGRYQWLLACEDLGSKDDTDFNDVVIGVNHVQVDDSHTLVLTALAAGGLYQAEVTYDGQPQFEIHDYLGLGTIDEMRNTESWRGPGQSKTLHPASFNIATQMGKLGVKITFPEGSRVQTAQILAPEFGSAPQMLCVPGDWEWPKERQRIETVYPGFLNWAQRTEDVTTWNAEKTPGRYVARGETPVPDEPVADEWVEVTKVDSEKRTYDGRDYDLYVPARILKKTPVVVSLHGAGGWRGHHIFSEAVADEAGCIVVYPNGRQIVFPFHSPDGTGGWQADGTSAAEGNPDATFIKGIVDDLKNQYNEGLGANYNIDYDRIYVCGYSNGGMMTYSLANAESDYFAAFASISGFPVNEFHHQTRNARPVPFLHIHCTDDPVVRYEWYGPVRDAMIARNGCNPAVTGVTSATDTKKYVYEPASTSASNDKCSCPYIFYERTGGNHDASLDNVDGTMNSSQVMWDFFKDRHLSDASSRTLRWSSNIDAGDATTYGWRKGTLCYSYGVARQITLTDNSADHNSYRSVQLERGQYKLVVNSTGSGKIYVKLEKSDGTSQVFCNSCQGGQQSVMPFSISEDFIVSAVSNTYFVTNGEYKITVQKENADITLTDFTIYSVGSLPSAVNCTTGETLPDDSPAHTGIVEVEQNRVDATTGWAGSVMVDCTPGATYTTYTVNSSCQGVAFKTFDVDIEGCDYIMFEFEEAIPAGWYPLVQDLAWTVNGGGVTEYKWTRGSSTLIKADIGLVTFNNADHVPNSIKLKRVYIHYPD